MSILSTRHRKRGGQRAAQKQQTHERLLAAGRRLFAQYGFEETTVTMLAEAAGVSVGLISAHFGSKAGLLQAILSDINQQQLDRMEAAVSALSGLRARVLWKLGTEYENDLSDPRLCAVLVSYSWVWPPDTEAENLRQRRRGDAIMREILAAGLESGDVAATADLDAAVAALYGIYLWGMRPAFYEGATAAQCLERITPQVEILLRGIAPEG